MDAYTGRRDFPSLETLRVERVEIEVDRFLVGGMRISTETRRRGLCLPLAEPFEP